MVSWLLSSVLAIAVTSVSRKRNAGLNTFAHKHSWHRSAWTGVSWVSNIRIFSTASASTWMPWIVYCLFLTSADVNWWQSSKS